MVIETIRDGNRDGFIAQPIYMCFRSMNRSRRVLSKEKIIHSFEDGKRVLSSIPEAAKES